jgi:hypothetical protein
MAAVQLGADTTDPRLGAAADRILDLRHPSGGFSSAREGEASSCLTARTLASLAALGQGRDPRFEEALAWLDEAPAVSEGIGWACPHPGHHRFGGGCELTAVGVLAMGGEPNVRRRGGLKDRAARAVEHKIANGCAAGAYRSFSRVNLMRTDLVEMLSLLAKAGVEYDHRLRPALLVLQGRQTEGGRWSESALVPASLPGLESTVASKASPWVTLRAARAILHYAVDARLPRLYPQRPS